MTRIDEHPAVTVQPRWWRRRRWVVAAATIALAGIAFVLVWFQPQKLLINSRVVEALPSDVVVAPPGASLPAGTTSAELAHGSLISLEHPSRGTVRVLRGPSGGRVLRLEGLNTSNGPDLFVYLSANPAHGPEAAFNDIYVSLGHLKGNQGDQNYALPADVDLSKYSSVVIWCARFSAAFAAADLVP